MFIYPIPGALPFLSSILVGLNVVACCDAGGYIGGMKFKPKEKKRGFKAMLARWLVNVARRIYPESKEVMAFYLQQIHDMIICGQSIVRVNPMDTKCVDEETLIVTTNEKKATFKRIVGEA